MQSFNFPSLSVFRSKHSSASSGGGEQSPGPLTSQLSIDSSIEEERVVDRMELPKHVTGGPGSR